ncbi:MAG: hypothetical protein ACD_78C00030G0003, partial [uncultured bacterium (gcode 4)]
QASAPKGSVTKLFLRVSATQRHSNNPTLRNEWNGTHTRRPSPNVQTVGNREGLFHTKAGKSKRERKYFLEGARGEWATKTSERDVADINATEVYPLMRTNSLRSRRSLV